MAITSFWKRLNELCKEKNVTPTMMCKELGLSTSNVTHWGGGRVPSSRTIKTIAEYFGAEPTEFYRDPSAGVTDDEIKFALFGETEITDEVFEEVKRFAKYAAAEEKKRKAGSGVK